MSNETKKQWAVIIDTDSYSGNFERELAAYVTGIETIRGEHFVREFQETFDGEDPFEGLFMRWPGEHGNELAHIHPTPGWGNNGLGDHVKLSDLTPSKRRKFTWPAYQSVILRTYEKPSEVQLEILREWALKFAAKSREPNAHKKYPFTHIHPINIIGIRVVCEETITKVTREISVSL